MNRPPLVLSLFPGADLFGSAFEAQGCCVVRGPEIMLGHDLRDWTPPAPGIFDGVIGGPPCQEFSTAKQKHKKSRHGDQIGLFWDLVAQIQPTWAVMENVDAPGTRNNPAIPADVESVRLRDWDCGGHTHRRRRFWVYPGDAIGPMVPGKRPGNPEYSVMASSHKTGSARSVKGMQAGLSPERAGELQGWPHLAEVMKRESNRGRIFPNRFIVHCMGNGVPRAMGEWIAAEVLSWAETSRAVPEAAA